MENTPSHITPFYNETALSPVPMTASTPSSESRFSTKEVVVYSAVGLALIGTSIFLTKRAIQKGVTNTQEKKALDGESPAAYAKRIKMAFDNDGWWGTDEVVLRNTLRSMPNKDFFKETAEAYKKLYKKPLTAEMQGELSSTEYEEMMMIIAAKPEKKGETVAPNYHAWAKRIRAAVTIYYGIFPGTDEDAIQAVFMEIPTQSDFKKLKEVYYQIYGDTLMDDLKGDLSSWYINHFLAIIKQKPL